MNRPFLALGIETSCDETAAAVVRNECEVLSNAVHSQIHLHARYRGVVPEVASRSHTERIVDILEHALEDAGVAPEDLDLIAVTARPGMIGSLLVGLAAAKALALRFDKPLVGVDHVAAHLHAGSMAEPDMPDPQLVYPVGILSTSPVFLARAVWPRRQNSRKQTCTHVADSCAGSAHARRPVGALLPGKAVTDYCDDRRGRHLWAHPQPRKSKSDGPQVLPTQRTHTRPARGQGVLTGFTWVAASKRQPASSTWASCSFSSWAAWR